MALLAVRTKGPHVHVFLIVSSVVVMLLVISAIVSHIRYTLPFFPSELLIEAYWQSYVQNALAAVLSVLLFIGALIIRKKNS